MKKEFLYIHIDIDSEPEIVGMNFFTEENGFSKNEIANIEVLSIGEAYSAQTLGGIIECIITRIWDYNE